MCHICQNNPHSAPSPLQEILHEMDPEATSDPEISIASTTVYGPTTRPGQRRGIFQMKETPAGGAATLLEEMLQEILK